MSGRCPCEGAAVCGVDLASGPDQSVLVEYSVTDETVKVASVIKMAIIEAATGPKMPLGFCDHYLLTPTTEDTVVEACTRPENPAGECLPGFCPFGRV